MVRLKSDVNFHNFPKGSVYYAQFFPYFPFLKRSSKILKKNKLIKSKKIKRRTFDNSLSPYESPLKYFFRCSLLNKIYGSYYGEIPKSEQRTHHLGGVPRASLWSRLSTSSGFGAKTVSSTLVVFFAYSRYYLTLLRKNILRRYCIK